MAEGGKEASAVDSTEDDVKSRDLLLDTHGWHVTFLELPLLSCQMPHLKQFLFCQETLRDVSLPTHDNVV